MTKAQVDETIVSFTCNIVYAALLTFVALAALNLVGVQTTSFVAVIGAAGLAVGFALQGSLSNLAAGVMIILFRPFKAGDFIEASGEAGVVDSVQIFTTTLTTPDNKTIIIPNSGVTDGNITNYSAKDTRRIDMIIGCGYQDDLAKVKSVLEGILNADTRILKDPEPTIGIAELGDNSVNFAVRPWVKTEDFWDVKFATLEAVKREFDAAGLNIPYPQRDVHVYQTAVTSDTPATAGISA